MCLIHSDTISQLLFLWRCHAETNYAGCIICVCKYSLFCLLVCEVFFKFVSVLLRHTPEVIPIQKCYMNLGSILNSYGAMGILNSRYLKLAYVRIIYASFSIENCVYFACLCHVLRVTPFIEICWGEVRWPLWPVLPITTTSASVRDAFIQALRHVSNDVGCLEGGSTSVTVFCVCPNQDDVYHSNANAHNRTSVHVGFLTGSNISSNMLKCRHEVTGRTLIQISIWRRCTNVSWKHQTACGP